MQYGEGLEQYPDECGAAFGVGDVLGSDTLAVRGGQLADAHWRACVVVPRFAVDGSPAPVCLTAWVLQKDIAPTPGKMRSLLPSLELCIEVCEAPRTGFP